MNGVVTEIKELRGGVRVTVNDGETFCLRNNDCKKHDLREGDRIDVQKLKNDLLLEQYPDALSRAVRLLALRARSCFEIKKQLTDACYLADTVEMVLTKLQSNGLLDDRAFAGQWARERTARQIGRARILHELRQKGVDHTLAEQVVAGLEADEQDENAKKLAEKLAKRYRNAAPEDARRKIIQAIRRRGYSYGEAKRALDETRYDIGE